MEEDLKQRLIKEINKRKLQDYQETILKLCDIAIDETDKTLQKTKEDLHFIMKRYEKAKNRVTELKIDIEKLKGLR